jgi:hypothetical protein
LTRKAVTALSLLSLGTASAETLPGQALRVLERAVQEESGFVQIHSAEALAANGHTDLARRPFAETTGLTATGAPDPARIGKWRVLALTSPSASERDGWIARVCEVAMNPSSPDRIQAVETLGKLHVTLPADEQAVIRRWAEAAAPAVASFPWWVLAINGAPDALPQIVAGLAVPDPIARLRAAYILKRDRLSGAGAPAALARAWADEKADSVAYPYLLCAMATLAEDPAVRRSCLEQLAQFATDPTRPSGRYEACLTLMSLLPAAEAAKLAPVLQSPDADTRIGAAWAILQLTQSVR